MTHKSVLLVDDSIHNLKLTRFLLEQEGFEVRTAENADQALAVLKEHTPDLILMDIQLPGMDGLQLTQRLREDTTLATVPIVAFTASALKGDEEIARAAGCDGYITKPINTRTLGSVVRGYAEQPRSADSQDSSCRSSDLL
jgi:CheY-like chemotaxis protein